jgi:hypothetical protein
VEEVEEEEVGEEEEEEVVAEQPKSLFAGLFGARAQPVQVRCGSERVAACLRQALLAINPGATAACLCLQPCVSPLFLCACDQVEEEEEEEEEVEAEVEQPAAAKPQPLFAGLFGGARAAPVQVGY